MNKKIFFFLVSISFFSLAAHQKQKNLTLDRAIHTGLKKRSVLKALSHNMQAIQQQGKTTLSKWLPHYAISTGIEHANGTGLTGAPSFFEFSAKQLVIAGTTPYDSYAILEDERKSVEAEYRATEDRIRFEIEKTFLQTWLLAHQKKSFDYQSLSTHANFQQKKAEKKLNLLDTPAWQEVESAFINSVTEINNFDQTYQTSMAHLCFALGKKGSHHYNLIWKPTSLKPLKAIKEYIDQGLQCRKELSIIDYKIKAKEKEISRALRQYLPSVSLFASVNLQDGYPNTPSSSGNGGLQLSWNIGNGLSYYFEAESLRASLAQIEQTRQELKKQIINEIITARNNLIVARRNLESKGFSLRARHATWKKKHQELNLGIITKTDLLQADYQLQLERFAWITARIDYEISERNLAFATGYGC